MEHRYSLSSSPRLSKPMADSTWIGGMSATQRSMTHQMQKSFIYKEHNNSSICLSNSLSNSDSPQNKILHGISRTSSSVSKSARQRLNLSHVDPKTFADVNSSGLASRIVEYQRDSSIGGRGLQRSISYNNVYNPVTQPRRCSIASSPLSHKPSLPSVSMTRIAPPERSFYCGNTLPSLLRSNSLVGVEKRSDQELSRENRPIMHPPPLQHESEPTRSVLEELKEISRKRINSGEIQPNDYNSKKSCNRISDFVDHPLHHQQQQHHQHQQQQHQLPILQPQPSFKRQRELTVTVPRRLHHPVIALPHQHQHHTLHMSAHHFPARISPQQSPEQLAKRRNCSYSNDIASSLSSSQLHSNKRKLYDKRSASNTFTPYDNASSASNSSSSPETSPRQQVAKIQRSQTATTDLHLQHLTRTQSTPITPLPATPAQRTVSAPLVETSYELKPKLTLFNAQERELQQEQQEQQQQQQQEQQPQKQQPHQLADLDSPDVDANEYAGIQFVKPKQEQSLGTSKNSHLERTQKTKLALMLSSLRGEIYQDEISADEADASKITSVAPTTTKTTAQVTNTDVTANTATTKPTILANATVSGQGVTTKASEAQTISSSAPTMPAISPPTPTSNVLSVNNATEKVSESAKSGAGARLGFTLPTATDKQAVATATATATSAATPALTFINSKPSTTTTTESPVAPAFTFGKPATPADAATLTTATTAPTTAQATSPGRAPATPPAPAPATATAPVTADPAKTMLTFGNAANNIQATKTDAGLGAQAAATTVQAVPSAAPTFNFGKSASDAAASNAPTAISTTAPATTGCTPLFSFGKAATTTTAAEGSTTNNPIAFGSSNSNSNSAAASANLSAAPADNNPAQLKEVTPFGSSTNNSFASAFKAPAAAATTAPATFSFGKSSAASAAPPLFGSATATPSAAATPAQPAFKFVGPPTAADSATSTNAAATAIPTNNSNIFSFGGANKPTAKATPFTLANKGSSSSNNIFSFGAGGDGSKATSTSEAPAAVPSTFSFSGAAPATNTFSFNAAAKPTLLFGSSNNATQQSKAFTFGGNESTQQQQQQQQQQTTPAQGGFSFAAVTPKSEPTNLFKSPLAVGTAGVKPSFNFGSNTASGTAAAAAPAAPAAAIAAGNAFGGFAAPAAPLAPSAANNQKLFTFGGSATPSNTANQGGNLFASAVSAVQNQQTKPGGFSFGGSTASNSSNPINANAPFTFGNITSPQASGNNAANKPFTFGSSAGNPTPSITFGSPAPALNGAAPFSFGGGANAPATLTSAQGMPGQQVNLFAPPTTPENRPIRRATRRLQK